MSANTQSNTFNYIAKHSQFKERLPWETSWIHITTITFTAKMNQEINLENVRAYFDNEQHTRRVGKWDWKMKFDEKSDFYNQVTIKYVDDFSTKSIKLFSNGSIQGAGATDLYDCDRICEALTNVLNETSAKKFWVPNGVKVAMINTNFNLNFALNLRVVQSVFSHVARVAFDPDRYSAVKIKFHPGENMKQVTASVFGTGKIIVTGAQSLDEIAHAYKFITQHVNMNFCDIKLGEPKEDSVTESFMGATYPQWLQAMKKCL